MSKHVTMRLAANNPEIGFVALTQSHELASVCKQQHRRQEETARGRHECSPAGPGDADSQHGKAC